MNIRTDLALERVQFNRKNIDGIAVSEEKHGETTVVRMRIESEEAAATIGKPIGEYTTISVPRFTSDAGLDRETATCLGGEIKKLLPKNIDSVLVAGLGNTAITPDSLGPKVANKVIATRHIPRSMMGELGLGELMSVSVIAPGVLGQTGIETGEIILGTADRISPSAVIVIDALAARSLERLGCTVQMSNTGICPGSGVGNARMEISENTLGIPVVSIGIPTVVDVKTLIYDLGAESKADTPDMIVTPKEVDLMIERAAELVAVGINLCLQRNLSLDDILGLI